MNKKELFQQLLEQIQLKNEVDYLPYFNEGEVEQVYVYKKSKVWHFILRFPDILPFEIFQALTSNLTRAFKTIADIDLQIKAEKPVITDEKIIDYWDTVINRSTISSPIVKDILRNHAPIVQDGVVTLQLANEITKNHLKDNYLSLIQQNFLVLGFPEFKIQVELNEKASEEMRTRYLERKEEQEAIMIQ